MQNLSMDIGAAQQAQQTRNADGSFVTTTSSEDRANIDFTEFLELMVAQFQNQDPENAASTTDMMNMLVQMTSVQAMNDMTATSSMQYAASLVGKEVTIGVFNDAGTLEEIVGTVTATGTYQGEQVIFVDDVSYTLSSLMAVGRLPELETEAGTEEGSGDSDDGSTDATETP